MFPTNQCPICFETHERLAKHIADVHPDEARRQDELVLKYYNEGLSARKIAQLPDVMYSGGTSVVRVLNKHLTPEQLETGRCERIGTTLEAEYATGKYDWVKDINTERNKSDEGRQKNSSGLQKVYSSGELLHWGSGLTADTSPIIAASAQKTSKTLTQKAAAGELKTLWKPGEEHPLYIDGRSYDARLYRRGQDFTKQDRAKIKLRAGNKCEKCGITKLELDTVRQTTGAARCHLECDHKTPIHLGGPADWEANGQALCSDCHSKKTALEQAAMVEQIRQIKVNEVVIEDTKLRVMTAIPEGFNFWGEQHSTPLEVLAGRFDGLVEYNLLTFSADKLIIHICPLDVGPKRRLLDLRATSNKTTLVFYADEWYEKQKIVLSMIGSRLMRAEDRTNARDCEVVELDHKAAGEFFEPNHISGHTREIFTMGLCLDSEVISAISFRRPFVKKHDGKIEIARFASKLGKNVRGGFSKLLNAASPRLKEGGYSSLLTYADLRFGTGAVYAKNGFELMGKTGLDYYYTNGHNRFGRFGFRAQDGMSEAEYAESQGVWKIWGCGSNIYELKL